MKPGSLVISLCSSRVMEIPPSYGEVAIGTSRNNDIMVVGEGLRPNHLVLRRRGKDWFAVGRGGGTLRTGDGRERRQVALAAGQPVSFGSYAVELLPGEAEDDTATLPEACVGPPPAAEIELAVEEPGGAAPRRRRFPGATRILVGRDPSCDVALRDPRCSLFHALVERTPSGWGAVDLGSRNGLHVDGRRVAGCALRDGSLVVAGRTRIVCRLVEGAGGEEEAPGDDGLLTTAALAPLVEKAARYAATGLPVLILGETGTGKELLARRMHAAGGRPGGPFVPVNCGAIPDTLAESLLFGHRRGSFTGADRDHEGFVGAARGGTLFLDEAGEMSPLLQAKLLRLLDRGACTPVGESGAREADVRVVAATNRDLAGMAVRGEFREDLYHRLAVLTLSLPPLRERPRDIAPLAAWMLRRSPPAAAAEGISAEALALLESHPWPGNARELRNVLLRAGVNAGGGVILPAHVELAAAGETGRRRLRDLDGERLRRLVEESGGGIAAAARALGVPRTTLRYHLGKPATGE